MSFSQYFGILFQSFILNGVNAFEGDVNGVKNEFSLKNMKKILPTSNPDEFDCVDIYKQPAFDHPLLKNHKIQLKPSFLKQSKKVRSKNSCPPGKVPIAKAKTSHPGNLYLPNDVIPDQHVAGVESEHGYTLHGARSWIEIYNPHPLKNFQFSMATIWVLSGPNSQLNSLQAGWGVHPFLYKDDKTHLTIYWTIDSFRKTGCYNTRCPGFVQTHPSIYPGQSLLNTSVIGKEHYIMGVSIFQERKTGNWWLKVGGSIGIGYWPKEILTDLAEKATQVRFGGWSFNFPSDPSPPMGSGTFPSKDMQRSSFFARLGVLDSSYNLIGASNLSLITRVDAPNRYNAIYLGNQGKELGDAFTYGGTGGSN